MYRINGIDNEDEAGAVRLHNSIPRGETCQWEQTCPDDNEWTGSCGESVGIETGQPFSYVQFKFCPRCGKQIEAVKE
jgi:hypothetical protein